METGQFLRTLGCKYKPTWRHNPERHHRHSHKDMLRWYKISISDFVRRNSDEIRSVLSAEPRFMSVGCR
jgi:hypothetical protein